MKSIIIPGFGSNEFLFNKLMPFIKNAVYADLPDHNYDNVRSFLDKINDKFNIIGWSLGSLFALNYAADNPDKINSLFLLGSTARFCSKIGYENGIEQKKLDQMTMLIRKRKEAVMFDFYSNILEHVDDKQYFIKLLMDSLADIGSLTNGLNELKTADMLDKLEYIKTKVLIIHGNNDNITPLKGAEILNGRLKNSELIIKEGGHSLFLEDPEYIGKAFNKFTCTVS